MGQDSCRLNAESFAECGDRGRAWKLLGLLSPSSPAIREAARYYQRGGDYQMCALVAAVFGLKGFDGEVRRYGRERKKELMFRARVASAEGAAFSFWGGEGATIASASSRRYYFILGAARLRSPYYFALTSLARAGTPRRCTRGASWGPGWSS